MAKIKYPCDSCPTVNQWKFDHHTGKVYQKPDECECCYSYQEWDNYRNGTPFEDPEGIVCPLMSMGLPVGRYRNCVREKCWFWGRCSLILDDSGNVVTVEGWGGEKTAGGATTCAVTCASPEQPLGSSKKTHK